MTTQPLITIAMAWCLLASACTVDTPAAEDTPQHRVEPAAAPRPDVPATEPELAPTAAHPQGGMQGGVIARVEEDLVVADEDHGVVRWVGGAAAKSATSQVPARREMPGPPAAVLAVDGRLFATVRNPGLVVELARVGEALREVRRVDVAPDAWGMTLSREGDALLVSSGWSHTITRVRIADFGVDWELNVPKEPRAIVADATGNTAYVTHLSGAALTRIDGLRARPLAHRVDLPAAPLRMPEDNSVKDREKAATLAYSAVMSPDGSRLFVPRHALGATGRFGWAGQPTVDVMLLPSETPLARRGGKLPLSRHPGQPLADRSWELVGDGPLQRRRIFVQPRATVYRQSTDSLLVASEGLDELVELDALSIDPSAHALARHGLRSGSSVERCGAPSGIALSEDEATAFVFCRTTTTIATVPLGDSEGGGDPVRYARLDEDPLAGLAGEGRRLFFDAADGDMSFGAACSSCHPDGRDDGHVWHEIGTGVLRAFAQPQNHVDIPIRGEPRQTPMLVSRTDHEGRFGWRGDSKSLEHRILLGFSLHHWWEGSWIDADARHKASALAAFLRTGLEPPPPRRGGPTALEARGREVFMSDTTACSRCHQGEAMSDFERHVVDLRAPGTTFVGKESARLRTPPLTFVGGSAPYLHDGSAPTLRALIEENHDRMGMTSHLTDEDKSALVAFLLAQGGPEKEPPTLSSSPRTVPGQEAPAGHDAPLSAEPTADAWKEAPPFALARASDKCSARRVREWIRIQCQIHAQEAIMLGGAAEGVRLSHSKSYTRKTGSSWFPYEKVDDLIVVFPVRPGDRRLIQGIADHLSSFDGRVVISETWLPGEEGPTIVAVH